jgi:hypothetical protein
MSAHKKRRTFSAPKYLNGREVSAPRSLAKPRAMNEVNSYFWDQVGKRLKIELDELAQGITQQKKSQARTRARLSAEARQQRNTDRNRRIHDRHAAGRAAKAIAGDERLTISTVNRILAKPRP